MRLLKVKCINGPNIYCYHSVIKLTVDLGNYAQKTTDRIEGFNQRLLQMLPSLKRHQCSRGYKGGFAERLAEGTYLGHVLEHLILELQYLAGYSVSYGTTIRGPEAGQAELYLEYGSYQPALYLARVGVQVINRLLANEVPELSGLWRKVDLIRQRCEPGPSTAAIMAEAKARDIPVSVLEEGSSLLQLGHGIYQKRVQATLASTTSCLAADIAGDKCLTKSLLARAGIPTPRGEVVTSAREAIEAAARLGVPVAVKPCTGNQGKGVSLNLLHYEEISRAFQMAFRYSSRVIVEEYITGRQYRLLVVGGKLAAAARRLPVQVTGNGVDTVAGLIRALNSDPRRGYGHARPLTRIKIDEAVRITLERQEKSLNYRPLPGEVVLLRENANLSTGGSAWDVTFKVHPENAALAERAASIIGLDLAGIDLVAEDLGRPVREGTGAVIEINAAPGIRMHLFPSRGRGRNVAREIVGLLFPGSCNGRVPVFSVTGTNGKTTTVRLLAHLLKQKGKVVGMATTDGVFIDEKRIYSGDTAGPRSARMILEHPKVETAVLETARGGIIWGGLGYDRSDIAVITNISADHLGQDGLRTVEDLVFVKSLVVEAVSPNGAVVLNADDPNVLKMLPRAAAPVVLFSRCEENLMLLRHLGGGGRAMILLNGMLCWYDGQSMHSLLAANELPLSFNGMAGHHIENAMAAASAALAHGMSAEEVADGLRSFTPCLKKNPGRGNLIQVRDCAVLLDYGHNPAAIEATLQLAARLGYNRLVGIVGVPGDRSSELIRDCGRVCGRYLDMIVIKEDLDLRGRKPGQTARLIREGILQVQPISGRIHIVLQEIEAVQRGLELAGAGDLLVIFYEHKAPILTLLEKLQMEEGSRQKKETLSQVAP